MFFTSRIATVLFFGIYMYLYCLAVNKSCSNCS